MRLSQVARSQLLAMHRKYKEISGNNIDKNRATNHIDDFTIGLDETITKVNRMIDNGREEAARKVALDFYKDSYKKMLKEYAIPGVKDKEYAAQKNSLIAFDEMMKETVRLTLSPMFDKEFTEEEIAHGGMSAEECEDVFFRAGLKTRTDEITEELQAHDLYHTDSLIERLSNAVNATRENGFAEKEEDIDRVKRLASDIKVVSNHYEERSFFSKWFTPAGWRERGSINAAKDFLKESLKDKNNVDIDYLIDTASEKTPAISVNGIKRTIDNIAANEVVEADKKEIKDELLTLSNAAREKKIDELTKAAVNRDNEREALYVHVDKAVKEFYKDKSEDDQEYIARQIKNHSRRTMYEELASMGDKVTKEDIQKEIMDNTRKDILAGEGPKEDRVKVENLISNEDLEGNKEVNIEENLNIDKEIAKENELVNEI